MRNNQLISSYGFFINRTKDSLATRTIYYDDRLSRSSSDCTIWFKETLLTTWALHSLPPISNIPNKCALMIITKYNIV